jgi:hypothetical protein
VSTRREPKRPVLVPIEPFVRLAMLAPHERPRVGPATSCEERTGALIKRSLLAEGLDAAALDRVWARLDRSPSVRGRIRLASPLAWALMAIVLLVSGVVVGAQTWPQMGVILRRLTGRPALLHGQPSIAARRAPARKLAVNQGNLESPPAQSPLPSPLSPPSLSPASTPSPAFDSTAARARSPEHELHAAAHVAAPAPTTPTLAIRDTTLADESVLLGRALAHLRQQRDPDSALVELDLYFARFPSGVLDHEAQSARVDALLMVGRVAEARTVLSSLTLGTGARDRELRLIRGELNAESACAKAIEDFETVMAESPSGPLGERALWGRAACRERLGDDTGARADLADYVARFPDGPHVAVARERSRK